MLYIHIVKKYLNEEVDTKILYKSFFLQVLLSQIYTFHKSEN